ncbi:CbtA family protein [Sulfitobacter sp. HI0023]|jgi:cobalt transporter subunit CbtA|uniref:CbtA family protein n=5 Tax=unclassified Sulfitobacter TaxID=196795 RepID=UPI0007C2E9A4|nr:CbtA family protein [Sulfitobacter sp. HI0023]KZX99621.1 cobalt transporter [Sulfitobacter sp. HI0023]MBO27354.1 cobalt transporter [Paracoccaceae bacterium]
MISRFVVSALFAGAAAGLIAGLLQLAFVQPVLLQAELFENGTLSHFGSDPAPVNLGWAAIDPVRDGLSIVFSMLIYTGYALVLVAAMSLGEERGSMANGRWGILWGIGGFIAFHLAPGFSLAPEVPGVAAADIGARQIWWYATVGAAIVALFLLAFGRSWIAWSGAVVLLIAPHVWGAPQPETYAGPVPPELAALFASRALGTGLAAWVVLGSLAGYFWRRETLRAG